jgi:hypothetical protein
VSVSRRSRTSLVGIWIPLLIFLVSSRTNAYVPWNGVGTSSITSRLGHLRRDGRRVHILSAFAKQNVESSHDARSKPAFFIRKAMYSGERILYNCVDYISLIRLLTL